MYDSEGSHQSGVALILFDCQENLPAVDVSFLATHVPTWNAHIEYEMIQMVFLFAEKHLDDHDCVDIFHS